MTNGTTSGTIEAIALSKLIASPANVRRARSEAGITELAASLLAHGQIQNLTVRKGAKGKFEVVAGARRLAAFNMLAKEAKITKEHGVICNVITEADDAEISLAENIVRERMGVVDEVTAFRALADKGQPAEEIAARFGISVITVRRRLKLARLSPRILEAMNVEEINLSQAEALALSDDHAEQEAAWFDNKAFYGREPRSIREILSREHVRADHKFAQFVGLDAYKQAGGNVNDDLFAERNGLYLTDRPLLTRLVMAKLEEHAAAVVRDGWGWAEPDIEGNVHYGSGFRRIYTQHRDPSPEQKAEMEDCAVKSDALAAIIEEGECTEEELEAAEAQCEKLQERIAEIETLLSDYDPEAKAMAGCVVSVDENGTPRVSYGLVRDEDWKAVQALSREPGQDDAEADSTGTEEDTGPALPAVLIEELTAQRTAALRIELASSPTVALAAALHPLLIRLFYRNAYGSASYYSAVELSGEQQSLTQAIQKPDDNAVLNAWNRLLDQTRQSLPKEVEGLWDWLNESPLPSLLDLMALVSAANLNAIQFRHEKKRTSRIDRADEIARAIYFDIKNYIKADEAFYERLSKKQLGEVMASEGADAEAVASMMKLPKYEAVHRTMAMMPMDYVPSCIQTRALLDDEDEEQDIAAE